MTTDRIVANLRRPAEHNDWCVSWTQPRVPTCNCPMSRPGPTWDEAEDAIAEIEALRSVVRTLDECDLLIHVYDWVYLKFGDLTPSQADAVRRALEAQP